MIGLIRSIVSPLSYQSVAPISVGPTPIALGLCKLGKAIKQAIGWSDHLDVYEPTRSVRQDPVPDIQLRTEPEWSYHENGYLLDALHFGFDKNNLIDDFAQSGEGNCALVATIKAAMCKFGRRLFRSVKKPSYGQYRVRLRDGEEVAFAEDALALARDSAGLKGDDGPSKAFAIFVYTVAAARRAQLMPAIDFDSGFLEGWLTEKERFERALKDLRTGHSPRFCAHYLGVGHELRVRGLGADDELSEESTIITSTTHAVFVKKKKDGTEADHYGHAVEFDGTDTNGRPARNRLTFEGPGLQEEDGWFYI